MILFAGDAFEPGASAGAAYLRGGCRDWVEVGDDVGDDLHRVCARRSWTDFGPIDLKLVSFDSYEPGGKRLGICWWIGNGNFRPDFDDSAIHRLHAFCMIFDIKSSVTLSILHQFRF